MADVDRRKGSTSEVVVPVVEEELEIGKTEETERVRVTTSTETREEVVEAPAVRELVDVERVRVDRPVDERPRVRVEGDTTIIPIVEEEIVVSKRLVVREEVRIRKRRVSETRAVRVPLRSQHVDIERSGGPASASTGERNKARP